MKEFTTAAADVAKDGEEEVLVEFKVDGREIKSHRPGEGQIAMLMAGLGKHSNDGTRVAAIIDFMLGVMDEDDRDYLIERLMDRKDKFGLTEVQGIMEYIVEEWSNRPTE